MSNLNDMILHSGKGIKEIGEFLDRLDPQTRIKTVRTLNSTAQKALWELAENNKAVLEDFVPPDRKPLEQVIHYGINTLPVFNFFEKRFCRPPEGEPQDELWGYNEGPTRIIVGPGYFVTHLTEGNPRGNTVIDYYRMPKDKPADWPALVPNTSGIMAVVWGYMEDFMRKVSQHVSIGRAHKKHLQTNNFFTLCREE